MTVILIKASRNRLQAALQTMLQTMLQTIMLRAMLLAVPLSVLLAACAGSGTADNDKAQTPDTAAEATAYAVTDSASVGQHDDKVAEKSPDTQDYELILERVKARSYPDDFHLLREQYIKTDLYKPFDSAERELTQKVFEALDDNNLKQCVKLADRILARNFLSLPAHRAAAICYEQSGDDIAQQFHENMYRGLLDAVAHSGNGSAPATAFVVINVDEIDALLQAQDLEVVSQTQLQQGEHEYNRVYVRNPQTGRQFDVYFDVSAEKRWYLDRLRTR